MKKILVLMLIAVSSVAYSVPEDNLKITEVGAWAQGNSIFYIRVDRNIGPTDCHDNLIKVYLGEDGDSEAALNSKGIIRALALTALTAKLNVKVYTLDTCMHGNPTINSLHVKN